MVHITDMASPFSMTMILFDNLVHHWSKGSVRVVGSCIDTNSRVNVLTARQYGLLESEAMGILSVLELIPKISGEISAEERFCAVREDRITSQHVW